MNFSGWWVWVLVALFMGPIMRMSFGGRRWTGRREQERAEREIQARWEAALAERDNVIEDLQHRISELESRLDFTERLLAERREPAQLIQR